MQPRLLAFWSLPLAPQAVGPLWLFPGVREGQGLVSATPPPHADAVFDVREFPQLRLGCETSVAAGGTGTLALDLVEWEGGQSFQVYPCGGTGFDPGAAAGGSALVLGARFVPTALPAGLNLVAGRPCYVNPRLRVLTGPITCTLKVKLWGLP